MPQEEAKNLSGVAVPKLFGFSDTHLTAIISKTVSRSVTCQVKLKISAKEASQECKVRAVAPGSVHRKGKYVAFWLFSSTVNFKTYFLNRSRQLHKISDGSAVRENWQHRNFQPFYLQGRTKEVELK